MKNAKMLVVAAIIFGVGQAVSAQELSRRDQLRIAVQKICPVSGQKLGENGTPIKAEVTKEGETAFFCCEGCLKGKINDEHWTTIHANIAKAQAICPVMKKPLPEDSKWTVVAGQVVYLCCPPCGKKIAADPATYLKQLDERYALSLREAKKANGTQPR